MSNNYIHHNLHTALQWNIFSQNSCNLIRDGWHIFSFGILLMQDHSNTKIPKVRCILAHPQTIRPLTASETHQTKTRYFPLNEIEKKNPQFYKLWEMSVQFLQIYTNVFNMLRSPSIICVDKRGGSLKCCHGISVTKALLGSKIRVTSTHSNIISIVLALNFLRNEQKIFKL